MPLAIRLDRLHLTLQAAFGWTNTHHYAFTAGGITWGIPRSRFWLGRRTGRCPPEDIGGPNGYAQFLEAFADVSHPRHAEFAETFPEGFNPRALDKRELEHSVDALTQKWHPSLRKK